MASDGASLIDAGAADLPAAEWNKTVMITFDGVEMSVNLVSTGQRFFWVVDPRFSASSESKLLAVLSHYVWAGDGYEADRFCAITTFSNEVREKIMKAISADMSEEEKTAVDGNEPYFYWRIIVNPAWSAGDARKAE